MNPLEMRSFHDKQEGEVSMKLLAINGSPRKHWNTATLLEKVLEGASSRGAETELVHLYDLQYQGCRSCFACKLKGGESYGKCAVMDDLAPLLRKIEQVDALVLGSPIYFGSVTGELRSFLERLVFQYLVYDEKGTMLSAKKLKTGLIYTMNVTQAQFKQIGYEQDLKWAEGLLTRTFGASESLFVTDTYQFDDYARYVAPRFDAEAKWKRRQEGFPTDCRRAFELGKRLVN